MNAYSAYIPSIIAAIAAFLLLYFNPSWIRGRTWGDSSKKGSADPIVTAIIIFLAGAITVWLMESRVMYDMM